MKKGTLCVRLMTLFMAIIGMNAAALVVYIFLHSALRGDFSSTDSGTSASAYASAQITAPEAETSFPNSIDTADSLRSVASASTAVNDNLTTSSAPEYDPAKQQIFEALQNKNNDLYDTPQQSEEYGAGIGEAYASNQFPAENTSAGQNTQAVAAPEPNIQAISSVPAQNRESLSPVSQNTPNIPDNPAPAQTIQESTSLNEEYAGSSNASGNGNSSNFYLYDIPEQQQTSDKYVLNTSTLKFHYPKCNDVRRIAPENYTTSNNSYSELIAQGYDPCGHCKPTDFSVSNDSPSTPGSQDNNSSVQPDNTPPVQQAESTYILSKERGYFHISSDCKFIEEDNSCIYVNASKEELKSQGYRACHCVEYNE